MARVPKPKKLAQIAASREGSIYRLQIEDQAGKKVIFEVTSDQTLRLADMLDNLLADEEEEQRPIPAPPDVLPLVARDGLGTVKWYNITKGFGFITPDDGSQEFLHRSVLEQAGLTNLAEGTRVRFQVVEGKRGPQVSTIALVGSAESNVNGAQIHGTPRSSALSQTFEESLAFASM